MVRLYFLDLLLRQAAPHTFVDRNEPGSVGKSATCTLNIIIIIMIPSRRISWESSRFMGMWLWSRSGIQLIRQGDRSMIYHVTHTQRTFDTPSTLYKSRLASVKILLSKSPVSHTGSSRKQKRTTMSALFYFLFVITSVAFCIVVFLLISAGDLATLKEIHERRLVDQNVPTLPVISQYGDMISTPEELDDCLMSLRLQLNDKHQEMENTRMKVKNRVDSLQKLENYKRGCFEMHADLIKIGQQCKGLESKIDYFKKLQEQVQNENISSVMRPMSTFAGDFMTYNTRSTAL